MADVFRRMFFFPAGVSVLKHVVHGGFSGGAVRQETLGTLPDVPVPRNIISVSLLEGEEEEEEVSRSPLLWVVLCGAAPGVYHRMCVFFHIWNVFYTDPSHVLDLMPVLQPGTPSTPRSSRNPPNFSPRLRTWPSLALLQPYGCARRRFWTPLVTPRG